MRSMLSVVASRLVPLLALPALLAVGAAPAAAQPTNDTCATAEAVLPGVPVTGSNEGAATESLNALCAIADDGDVWYRFQAPQEGTYRFELLQDFSATLLDTSLAVFSACGGSELACDGDGGPSKLDVALGEGQEVRVRVAAGFPGARGVFTLSVDLAPMPPANDGCGGATPLVLGERLLADNVNTAPSGAAASCIGGRRDVWYSFTASVAGRYSFSVRNRRGGENPLSMALYRDCSLVNELGCDASCRPLVRASVDMAAGEGVVMAVMTCSGGEDLFDVRVDPEPATPTNGVCAAAVVLAPGTQTSGATAGAPIEEQAASCGSFDETDHLGVWYAFTNTTGQRSLFRLSAVPDQSFEFSLILRAFSGGCGGEQIACAGANGPEGAAVLTLVLDPAESIRLRVGGAQLTEGSFVLSASAGAVPAANDDCDGAIAIAPGASVSSTTDNASGRVSYISPCGTDDEIDVWYRLTNPEAGPRIFTIDMIGTTTLENPGLAAYAFCGTDDAIACNRGDQAIDSVPRVALVLEPSQTVWVRVAGSFRAVGDFTLNVSQPMPLPPVPANDLCENATQIASFPFGAQVAVATATDDLDIPCDSAEEAPSSAGIWYTLAPAADCVMRFTSADLSPPTFAVFEGPCGSPVLVDCGQSYVPLSGGTVYRLLVVRPRAEEASPIDVVDFTVDCLPVRTPGDACADAAALTLPVRGLFDTSNAANEGPSDAPAGSCNDAAAAATGLSNSVYFSFTAPANGVVSGVFEPEFFASIAALYTGGCGTLTEITCDEGIDRLTLSAQVAANTTYVLQYGSFPEWSGGRVAFELAFEPAACRADFDGQNGVQVADIFAFLRAWFANDASADFDGQSGIQVADIFAFLRAWFAGCP